MIQIILTLILSVTLTTFIIFEYKENRKAVLVFKTISSLLFIAIAVSSLFTANVDFRYAYLIVAGLSFSLLGDVMLVFINNNNFFKAGLIFFLIAQVIYGITFTLYSGFYVWDLLIFTGVVAVLIFAYKKLDMDVGSLKIPVLIYVIAITYMMSKAVSLTYENNINSSQAILASIGAFLFFVSDAILAVNKFHIKKFKSFRALNLITYYAGQTLIAFSVVFSEILFLSCC